MSASVTARCGKPRTCAWPSSSTTSAADASSRCAASVWIFGRKRSVAVTTVPPMETAPRLPNVPLPSGALRVSVGSTRTRSSGTPSRSAMTCAIVVACPCPWEGKLVAHRTLPSGSTRTLAASMPGTSSIPRPRKTSEPMPVYSV